MYSIEQKNYPCVACLIVHNESSSSSFQHSLSAIRISVSKCFIRPTRPDSLLGMLLLLLLLLLTVLLLLMLLLLLLFPICPWTGIAISKLVDEEFSDVDDEIDCDRSTGETL